MDNKITHKGRLVVQQLPFIFIQHIKLTNTLTSFIHIKSALWSRPDLRHKVCSTYTTRCYSPEIIYNYERNKIMSKLLLYIRNDFPLNSDIHSFLPCSTSYCEQREIFMKFLRFINLALLIFPFILWSKNNFKHMLIIVRERE